MQRIMPSDGPEHSALQTLGLSLTLTLTPALTSVLNSDPRPNPSPNPNSNLTPARTLTLPQVRCRRRSTALTST